MSTIVRSFVVTLMILLVAAPAAFAAPPSGEKEVFVDVDESGIFEDLCDFDLKVIANGHMRTWMEPRGRSSDFRRVIAVRYTITNLETGETIQVAEAGQDRLRVLDDGRIEIAIIGRAATFGTIGRLVMVFSPDFQDLLDISFAGRDFDVCALFE